MQAPDVTEYDKARHMPNIACDCEIRRCVISTLSPPCCVPTLSILAQVRLLVCSPVLRKNKGNDDWGEKVEQ